MHDNLPGTQYTWLFGEEKLRQEVLDQKINQAKKDRLERIATAVLAAICSAENRKHIMRKFYAEEATEQAEALIKILDKGDQ